MEDLSPEKLEELKKRAAASVHDNPDPDGTLHRLAEATLSISCEEADRWRITYTMPHGATISINSKMPVELAVAQIRGMMADFAGRELVKKGGAKP